MNDIIKTVKSLEDLEVLIDGVTDKVKHEIKKNEGGASFASTFSHFISATSDFFSSKGCK